MFKILLVKRIVVCFGKNFMFIRIGLEIVGGVDTRKLMKFVVIL